MPCNDPRYQYLLADAVMGKLSAGEMFQIQSHLRSCETCRESFRAGAILSRKDYEVLNRDFGGHLSNDELTQYYSERAGLEASALKSIESHLEHCMLCRDELRLFELVEQEMLTAAKATPRAASDYGGWQRVKAIVLRPVFAAAVLIVVAMPFYLLWRDQGGSSLPIVPGVPSAIELKEPSRSTGSIQVISKRPGDSILHLSLPYPHQVNNRLYSVKLNRAENMNEESPPVWLKFSQAGEIDLLVEALNLRNGRYELTIFDVGRDVPADTLITSFTFDLKIQD